MTPAYPDTVTRCLIPKDDHLGETINNEFSPGYSAFLALLYWLSHTNLRTVLLMQAFVSSLVPLCIYFIGLRVTDRGTAGLCAVLTGLSSLLNL